MQKNCHCFCDILYFLLVFSNGIILEIKLEVYKSHEMTRLECVALNVTLLFTIARFSIVFALVIISHARSTYLPRYCIVPMRLCTLIGCKKSLQWITATRYFSDDSSRSIWMKASSRSFCVIINLAIAYWYKLQAVLRKLGENINCKMNAFAFWTGIFIDTCDDVHLHHRDPARCSVLVALLERMLKARFT